MAAAATIKNTIFLVKLFTPKYHTNVFFFYRYGLSNCLFAATYDQVIFLGVVFQNKLTNRLFREISINGEGDGVYVSIPNSLIPNRRSPTIFGKSTFGIMK